LLYGTKIWNRIVKWAIFGKQNWRCVMKQSRELRCQNYHLSRYCKRCYFIQTAGRWPWKSEPAKKCVTTYQHSEVALKMDGA